MKPRSSVPDTNSLRIRPLRLADYRAVHALWTRTPGVGVNDSDTRAGIRQFLKRNPGLSLVATSRGHVVGTILCGHDGRRGYLHHLAVSPTWRRRGIGRTLVAACLEQLCKQGVPKCSLFIFANNTLGKAFWKSLGWTVRQDLRIVQRGTPTRPAAATQSC
jgi:ribosomal protein S18 acetylase RimI-like enzyme